MTRRYSWVKSCCVATGAQAVRGTQPHGPLKQISRVEVGRGLEEEATRCFSDGGSLCQGMGVGCRGGRRASGKRGLDLTTPRTAFGPEPPDKPSRADL